MFDSHGIGPSVPVQARGPVVTSSSVQQAMQDRDTQTAAPCSHWNLWLPGVGDGVVRLNRCQVRGAVIPELMRIKKKKMKKVSSCENTFFFFCIILIKQTLFVRIIQNHFFSIQSKLVSHDTVFEWEISCQINHPLRQRSASRHSPSHGVQSVADGGHAHPCPPGGHGRNHVPTICPGVVRLAVTVDGKEAAATWRG